jgi:glycosyltransferase involved in cell wall biosynthesis
MMKVTHLITSLDSGGAEQILYRVCTTDTNAIHTVISLRDKGVYGAPLEERGIRVHTLDLKPGRLSWAAVKKLHTILTQNPPDVLQTWMYHAEFLGSVVGWWAGVGHIVWSIHNTDLLPGQSSRLTILISNINAWLSHRIPDKIIACGAQARLAHIRQGYDPQRFVVVPNGYDLSVFQPDPGARKRLRAELGIADSEILTGTVARIDPMKDHRTLLSALARVRDQGRRFTHLLVGDGCVGTNPVITDLIAEYGLASSVRLLGRRSDIPAVMNALDLHVLSSQREAFPNALAEAMACGTPCVSTDAGDAALIVGTTGWVVPIRDPSALADAIGTAIGSMADPETWQARASACREHISASFTLDEMINGYHSVWLTATTPSTSPTSVS